MRTSPRYWVRVLVAGTPHTFWYCTRRRWERVRRQLQRERHWHAAGRVRR